MSEEQDDLGEYEGYPIIDSGIIITKTGDGLSDAVKVEYVYIEPGDDAHSVMRLRKTKDRFDFVRDPAGKIIGVKLIQVFACTGAAFSDEKVAKAAVAKMMDRIAEKKALEKGQLTLGVDDGEEDNITPIKPKRSRKAQ